MSYAWEDRQWLPSNVGECILSASDDSKDSTRRAWGSRSRLKRAGFLALCGKPRAKAGAQRAQGHGVYTMPWAGSRVPYSRSPRRELREDRSDVREENLAPR